MLDVATGAGGYIPILQRYLNSYASITGMDADQKVLRNARAAFDDFTISFTQMNAEILAFDDDSFDTVNISASLHHLENVSHVLAETKRVLRPGGKFILTETHRDGSTEEQFIAVRIHHWAAAVDSSLGILHDRTFARQEILDFIEELNLVNTTTRDFSNTNADPFDEKAIAGVSAYMDRYHQRLSSISTSDFLIQQEAELRASLAEKGFHREPLLIIIAEKA